MLKSPVVTEKSASALLNNKYTFYVSAMINKIQISQIVEDTYSVKVKSVNIINLKGKIVSRGRLSGKRKDRRKAVVTLCAGFEISELKSVIGG